MKIESKGNYRGREKGLEVIELSVPPEIFQKGTEHEFVKDYISQYAELPPSRIVIAGIEETGVDIILQKKETFGVLLDSLSQASEEDPLTYGSVIVAYDFLKLHRNHKGSNMEFEVPEPRDAIVGIFRLRVAGSQGVLIK